MRTKPIYLRCLISLKEMHEESRTRRLGRLLLEVFGRQRFVGQEVESLAISSLSDTRKVTLRREDEVLLEIMSL